MLCDFPVEINVSFNLEVDDFQSRKLYEQLNNDTDSSFSLLIVGAVLENQNLSVGSNQDLDVGIGDLVVARTSVGVSLFNQSFNNVKLVSQEFNSNADEVLSVKLNYKGYLN